MLFAHLAYPAARPVERGVRCPVEFTLAAMRRTSVGLPSWSPGHHRSPLLRCVSVASVSKVERKSPAQSGG